MRNYLESRRELFWQRKLRMRGKEGWEKDFFYREAKGESPKENKDITVAQTFLIGHNYVKDENNFENKIMIAC